MKNKFKYQWDSFFDYLGAYDSSLKGKRNFFFQRIKNDAKNKDEKYFNHIWIDEKEKNKRRIKRYAHLVGLRTMSLPLIVAGIILAVVCFLLQSWLLFTILAVAVWLLIPYWIVSYGFVAEKDTCISYLQWMDKVENRGEKPDIIAEAFEENTTLTSFTIADLPEITQSELTALIAILILSDNLNLSVDEKDFLNRISTQITIAGKEANPKSFYKSYSRFKNDPLLAKSAYNDLLDKLKNIDLDKI